MIQSTLQSNILNQYEIPTFEGKRIRETGNIPVFSKLPLKLLFLNCYQVRNTVEPRQYPRGGWLMFIMYNMTKYSTYIYIGICII